MPIRKVGLVRNSRHQGTNYAHILNCEPAVFRAHARRNAGLSAQIVSFGQKSANFILKERNFFDTLISKDEKGRPHCFRVLAADRIADESFGLESHNIGAAFRCLSPVCD